MGDYSFKGQYAKYAKFLTMPIEKKKEAFTILPRLMDVYIFSAVYGYLNNAYKKYEPSLEDESTRDEIATIKEVIFIKDRKYPLVRKMILLNEKSSGRSPSERIDAVFRYDYLEVENSMYEVNTEIMDGYVLGGLCKIYEQFKNVRTKEACAKLMYDMVHEFANEVNIEKPMDLGD